jgi:xanthine dehydrogenase molybdopterin-binding subunit B
VQSNLSRVLGVPRHKIIVKTKRLGGGFGGKERLFTAMVRLL